MSLDQRKRKTKESSSAGKSNGQTNQAVLLEPFPATGRGTLYFLGKIPRL